MATCTLPRIDLSATYNVECWHGDTLKWVDNNHNLVVNTGLEYALDRVFGTATQPQWFCGLMIMGYPVPEDTMADHEFTEFLGTASNSRMWAQFVKSSELTYVAENVQAMITENKTINGAFMTTGQTKGGVEGVLYGAANFTAPKDVVVGDALIVTITLGAKS
jgi:hypothetical protein